MVISSEGYFYSYNIDLDNGGECSLMKQYRQVEFGLLLSHWRWSGSAYCCYSFSLLDSGDESSGMTD